MNPEEKFDMKKQLDIVEPREAVMIILVNQETKEKVYPHKKGPVVIHDSAFQSNYGEGFVIYRNGEKLEDVDVSSPVGMWRMESGKSLENAFEADVFTEKSVEEGDTLTIYWKEAGSE